MACPNTEGYVSDVNSIGYDPYYLVCVCQFGSCLPQYQVGAASTLLRNASPANETDEKEYRPTYATGAGRAGVKGRSLF